MRPSSSSLRALRRRLAEVGPLRGPGLLVHRALWYLARRLLGPRTFALADSRHRYLVHPFILDNERAVEIPLALAAVRAVVRERPGARILEVGNVLSSFVDLDETTAALTVVDKYERAPGVLNVDIVEYRPAERFDLVVSISTLEHVGRDETPRQPSKAVDALEHLKTLVTPGGHLLLTVPVGYNQALDHALSEPHDLQIDCLVRAGRWNRWREAPLEETLTRSYGAPFHCANGLLVVSWRGPSDS
ncbi:MAG: methyltransferase domain-containing protein [Acidobacteriota bacterium]